MKYRYLIPLYILAFLLQGTLFSALPVFGVTPDLVLLLTLLVPLCFGGRQTIAFGFFFGLLRDVCFGVIIGPYAVLYALSSFFVLLLRGVLYAERFYTIPLVVLGGTLFVQTADWAILRLTGKPYAFLTMAERLPQLIVLELICAVVFYLLFGRNAERFAHNRELFRQEEFGR